MGLFNKKVFNYCNDPEPSLTPEQMEHRNELHKIARQALENQHVIRQNEKWFYTVKYEQEGLTYLNDILNKESNIFIPILETVSEEITKEYANSFIIESTLSEIPGYKIVETKGIEVFDFNIGLFINNATARKQELMARISAKHANAFINTRWIVRGDGAFSVIGEAVILEKENNN